MSDHKRVSTIVFDVNETLLDLTTLAPLFQRLFGTADVMREWFAELVLYSQTLTLSGHYTPFADLAGGVLRMVAKNKQIVITEDDISGLKSLIGSMPAYADVAPALTKLREAGFRLVTLTNSAPSASPTPLEKAGIAALFDHHFSVDAVKKFKPHPATYQLVADKLGLNTSELCMLACHDWDTIGAQAVGYKGAFIARPHNSVLNLPDVPQPDFVSDDLSDLADQIIAAGLPRP
ncbi:haloacid dehalogenase type II [Pseudorhodobacter turbinis]|uniref:(S)-2-haloacid dehalogenase n=1 Tax=Pseudorhodobacter turbinis TaxID=2500533 RepID=A0A4P8EFB0_9RHOB|nr:haloacid dehalogenase type II [Pseudorhodobacter turbinis]QCO55382.1 haloacid dehalogenase type II [Pseudorhodobacter turbinis]